ncbi:MAG: hypothetical protein MHMPM18_002518 [Marteilia pararefringens]
MAMSGNRNDNDDDYATLSYKRSVAEHCGEEDHGLGTRQNHFSSPNDNNNKNESRSTAGATAGNSDRKITRFMVRYYPPGFIVEYDEISHDESQEIVINKLSHCIDLQNIENQDPSRIVEALQMQESLLANLNFKVLLKLVKDLQLKLEQRQNELFTLISSTKAHKYPIVDIDINKDSQSFITCDSASIKLWNSQNCRLLNESHPMISTSQLTSFTALKLFQSNSSYIISGNGSGQCEVRDYEKMQTLSQIKLNSGPIRGIVINSFSSFAVAFGTQNNSIDIFDLPNCEHLGTLSANSVSGMAGTTIKSVKFDGSGMLLNALHNDGSLFVWDLGMQNLLGSYQSKSDQNRITCFDIAWDGSFLAAGNKKGHIVAYSPDFKYQDCLFKHQNSQIDKVCVSSNVHAIASKSNNQSYFSLHDIFDRKTSRIVTENPILDLGFSPKGDKIFVSNASNGSCAIFKTNGALHQTIQLRSQSPVQFTKFSYSSDSLIMSDSHSNCFVYGS